MAAPVKNTCPDIDRVIKQIKTAMKIAMDGMNENERHTDNYKYFEYINNELWRLDDTLEDLRSANDTLRSWGTELESELETAANQINDLENEIEEIKSAA